MRMRRNSPGREKEYGEDIQLKKILLFGNKNSSRQIECGRICENLKKTNAREPE